MKKAFHETMYDYLTFDIEVLVNVLNDVLNDPGPGAIRQALFIHEV